MPTQALTEYDDSHPWQKPYEWQNSSDRVSWERTFNEGTFEQRQIAQAMLSANPLTPSSEIRSYCKTPVIPSKYGYRVDALGIRDVLDVSDEPEFRANDDFSGRVSGYQGSSYPMLDIT